MQINHGLAFWGVGLITAGAVALAIQAGALDADAARGAWRFWPALLIVIGLAVILARTPLALVATLAAGVAAGGLAGTLAAGFGGDASVELDFTCGELSVVTDAGMGWSIVASHAPGAEPRIAATTDRLAVESRNGGPFDFAGGRQEWEVTLPDEPTLDVVIDTSASSTRLELDGGTFGRLEVDANAGDLRLLLGDAQVDELLVDANAGSIGVAAGAGGDVSGRIELNAGSLDLCVADDAVAEITLADDNITFSHNLDDAGLARTGDTWRSGAGDPDVSLVVEGNAASLTFDPDGGCA